MSSSQVVGGIVIAIAGVLLAGHVASWRDLRRAAASGGQPSHAHSRRTLERRTYASALMAILGMALFMQSAVPVEPKAMTIYVIGLLAAVVLLAAAGIADWRHGRRRLHRETLADLRSQLAEHLEKQRAKLAESPGTEAQATRPTEQDRFRSSR